MTDRDQGGFAFAFVVFVLFIIGVLGSSGYTVVQLEADMSLKNDDYLEASAVARAGLARYLGEHLGIPEDTVEYSIGTGTASVSARYIDEVNAAENIDLYLITSTAEVTDPRYPNSPSTRTIRQFARLHREPIARNAALQASYSSIALNYYYYVSGYDISGASCADSGEDVYGIAHRGSVSTFAWGTMTFQGDPSAHANVYGNHTTYMDSLAVRWDVLSDPDFPVEYDQTFPNFWSLPPDEYPIVRTTQNFTANSSHSGRGVLIVPGRLSIQSGFSWEGIILAGEVGDTSWQWFVIYGMLLVGLNGTDSAFTWNGLPIIYYDVCAAIDASNSLAWFEPIAGSAWEES